MLHTSAQFCLGRQKWRNISIISQQKIGLWSAEPPCRIKIIPLSWHPSTLFAPTCGGVRLTRGEKKGGSFQTWLDEIFQKNPIVFSAPKWMTFNDGRNMTNDPNILVSTLCFGGTMLFCITSGTDYPLFSEYKWITNKMCIGKSAKRPRITYDRKWKRIWYVFEYQLLINKGSGWNIPYL